MTAIGGAKITSEDKNLPTLGVDVGGTKIETALVNTAGRILASHHRSIHPEKNPDRVIADIVASIEICLREANQTARGLGIGVAGQVDKATGTVRFSPNLGWRNMPLQARLEEALGLPMVVNNDVRAATWAEWRHGAGQGVNDLVPLAHRLVEETAQYLAAGLVSIVNAFNPCLLILGGGVIQGLPEYVPMIERSVRASALETAVEHLRIVTAALGNKAGVIGAASLARNKIGKPL